MNNKLTFSTVAPCQWLDNKHTIFGVVSSGMDVVNQIAEAKTHPKTDQPYDDISIINITIK